MGIGKWIISPKIKVGQHDWAIKYFPQGKKEDQNGKYVSIFLELQRENVDVTAEFAFELLDKNGNVSPTTLNLLVHTFTLKAIDWGFFYFFERTKLEQTYIKDDCFVVHVSIAIGNASNVLSSIGFPYASPSKVQRGE